MCTLERSNHFHQCNRAFSSTEGFSSRIYTTSKIIFRTNVIRLCPPFCRRSVSTAFSTFLKTTAFVSNASITCTDFSSTPATKKALTAEPLVPPNTKIAREISAMSLSKEALANAKVKDPGIFSSIALSTFLPCP